jgi:hypothetical protein
MSVESYKHRYAKEVLAEWLQSTVDYGREKGYYPYRFDKATWVPKKDCPNRGVFLEYPIVYRYLTDSDGNKSIEYLGVKPGWTELPDLEKLKEKDIQPCCILDVAVLGQDGICYGFEIEHRHATEQPKIDLLKKLSETVKTFEVYEISADWVLEQVRRPKKLEAIKIV